MFTATFKQLDGGVVVALYEDCWRHVGAYDGVPYLARVEYDARGELIDVEAKHKRYATMLINMVEEHDECDGWDD